MEASSPAKPQVETPRESRVETPRASSRNRPPVWALAIIPLVLIVAALVALLTVGGDTLGERLGPPAEEIAAERTVLRPGEIDLTVRNTGPDPVTVAQMFVNDAYVDYTTTGNEIGPRGTETFTLDYPWQEGSPYLVTLVSETGATVEHEIPVAVATPSASGGFFGLMALLGTYVGIIPVALGMLFLPFLRRVREHWIRFFMAVTVGLLAFLALDAYLEGTEIAESGTGAFGGVTLLFVGAGVAYLGLVAVDRALRARRERARDAGAGAFQLSLLVAIGIGLHNLGEGLAIGSAYAIGELALGAFLVFGFALHNTTEGLAIVAPLTAHRRPSLPRLVALGLLAGAPAILGAFIGASVYNPELAALLIGVGIGAIVQVIVQLVPTIRDRAGRVLYPASVGGIITGAAVLYLTGLLISA
jgi:ZIP family zinc transporter